MRGAIANQFGLGEQCALDSQERRKQVLLAARIGLAVGLPFSIYNLNREGMFALGLAELSALILLVVPAAILGSRSVALRLAEELMLLAGVVIFGALIAIRGVEGTGLFWSFMYPFLAFFLKGQKDGWRYSLAFILAVASYLLYLRTLQPSAYQYSVTYAIHYSVTLCCFTVVASGFNRLRSRFEEELQARVRERTAAAKAYLDQLQFQATHDALTGLPNRVQLAEILKGEIEQANSAGQGLVVCNLHLERFFELGNVLGINGADDLIRQVTAHLAGHIAGARGVLARTRRDEFVILYRIDQTSVSPEQLRRFIADRELTLQVHEYVLHIEFTLGLSISPTHSSDPAILLQRAEQAMLQARNNKLRWSIYDEELELKFVQHHLLFGRMCEAIRLKQFQVFYQPQLDLGSGRVIGAEALTRWLDPVEGMISPAVFIPVAEESGLIRPLTEWLVRECLFECARWQELGLDMTVSINISAITLSDPELSAHLRNTAAEAGLLPSRVNLEITESCFISSPERSLEAMRRIREVGFRLSIDDFGTGFSSLSYLKTMPINELKIDQSFVCKLLESSGDQSIVTSTIDLAHNFGLAVVAEGIEDEPTADWLRAHRCDIGQGYKFARPMKAKDLVPFVLALHARSDQDRCNS